jgi:hypothetical protein
LELSHKLANAYSFIDSENVYVDKIDKSQSESNVNLLNINDYQDVDSLRKSKTHQGLKNLLEVIIIYFNH